MTVFWGGLTLLALLICVISMYRHMKDADESMFWVALFFACCTGSSLGMFLGRVL